MLDQSWNGKSFRILSIKDDFNCEGLVFGVDFLLTRGSGHRSRSEVIQWRRRTAMICANNGPELINTKLIEGELKHHIAQSYILPRKLQKNDYLEKYD